MRIRTIKPEFWVHPVMAKLDDSIKLLAIGLLNYSDDEGYFFAEENLVRSALRPFDDDSTIVRASLKILEKIGYIEVKESASHGVLGRVVNFTNHQRVDRPKSSHIKDLYNSSNDLRLIDDQSLLEGKGKEGNGTSKITCVVEAWNCLPNPFPKVIKLSDDRKKHLKARIKDQFFLENFDKAIKLIPSRPFLCGKNDTTWVADFDWFIKPGTVERIIEGKYQNGSAQMTDKIQDLSNYIPK